MANNAQPRARIVKGALVITIPAGVLKFATENHPDYWDGENDRNPLKVTDAKVWMKSVRDALQAEEEDGSTMLTAALDKAIAHAVEQGEEGCELIEESTAK